VDYSLHLNYSQEDGINLDTIGERLKSERIRLGYSQTNFANIGGVKKNAQVNYENNSRHPDAEYFAAISKIGADINYIITGIHINPIENTIPRIEDRKVLDALKFLRSEIDLVINQIRGEK